MKDRFTCTSPGGRRATGFALAAACLLLACPQTADVPPEASQQARTTTLALLQRAQDEQGRRQEYLPRALARIELGLWQTRGEPLEYAQWLRALWFYHLLNDEHVRARDALEESLRHLARAQAAPELVAGVTSSLSYSLILLGEIAKAKEYLRRAIVLASQTGDRALLADLYYNLGDAYRKTGERKVSRRYFESAYEIDRAAGDESKTQVSELKLGSLARDVGDHQEAVQRHLRALAQFEREHNYWELVTRIELARDYAAQGNLALAGQYARQALEDRRALLEQRIDASVLLLRIVNDHRTRERRSAGGVNGSDTSIPAVDAQADALVRNIRQLLAQAAASQRSGYARPHQQLQFAEQAIRHHALRRELAEVTSHGRAAIRLVRRVAGDLRATHDDVLAWLTAAQPVLNEYVKALYELDRSQVLQLLETYYGRQSDPAALRYSGVIGHAFEAQGIEVFERYQAAQRTLLDATAQVEKLQQYASDTAQLAAARALLELRLRERDRARDAYLAMYAAQPAANLPAEPEEVSFVPFTMPAGDVLIRYFVQENVSFGVALAANEHQYFALPPRSEVAAMTRRALAVLQAPADAGPDRAALSALARLVPQEFLARHPRAQRLIIVPDDTVQPVPFAAIDIGAAGQAYRPLVERFQILRTKSASRYYAAQVPPNSAAVAAADIVVFADPVIAAAREEELQLRRSPAARWSEGLSRLPSTQKEAQSIARTYASRRVRTYLGSAATNEVLLSADARAAKVLHIATHGYASTTAPEIVGLATSLTRVRGEATGGFLGLTELFTEPFYSRLVVISGCETMRGTDYSGWGVRSLADGFLVQGAGSVLGTLWTVSDDATAVLMGLFYEELHRHNNSSAALNRAQRRMLRSDRFSHPYYWAGVALESAHLGMDQRVL